MISKKYIITAFFLIIIGFFQGYFVASFNYNRVIEDMYRVAEENKIRNKKEVDKLVHEEGLESARIYIDDFQAEYDELYNKK